MGAFDLYKYQLILRICFVTEGVMLWRRRHFIFRVALRWYFESDLHAD